MRLALRPARSAFALVLVLGVLVTVAGGCASGARADEPRSASPRVRCLSDARGDATSGQRPIFFFLCTESP
jgi:hypothetical protein